MTLARGPSGGLVKLIGTNSLARLRLWTPVRITTTVWYDIADTGTLTGQVGNSLGVYDFTANSGLNPYTGQVWKDGDQFRLAFVTSTTIDATSSDIADYNNHVQAAANAAGLGSATWKAFVSTPTVNARTNTGLTNSDVDTAMFNFASQIVGSNIADLFDVSGSSGGPENKIQYDENGNGPGLPDLPTSVPFYQFTPAWTGCGPNGETENPVSGASVNGGICEAEKWFQWKRFTSSATTQQTYIIAISELLTATLTGPISQVDDKGSSGANHATQGTGSRQPTYNAGESALVFDGTSDIMQIANDPFKNLQDFAVIALQKWNASATWSNMAASWDSESGANLNGWSIRQRASNVGEFIFTRRSTGGADDPTPTTTNNQSDFIGVGYRSTPNIQIRHNGTITYSATNDTGSIGYSGTNRSAIGGYYDADNWTTPLGFLNGYIKELIVIPNATLEDVYRAEGYLAWKWGLEAKLPVSHPYKNYAPTI